VPSGTTTDTIAPAPVHDLSMDPDGNPAEPFLASTPTTEVASDAR